MVNGMSHTHLLFSIAAAAFMLLPAMTHAEPDTSGIHLVEDAPHQLYPELARQYLDAARWAAQQEDYESLVAHLTTAANYGSGGAHYELARLYIEGIHVPRNMNAASVHLNAAAGLAFNEGQRVLGRMLIRGDLDMKDVDRGFALLQQAAQSSVRAKRELGMLYAGLLPSPIKNLALGRSLLVEALQLGDQEAGYQLAQLDEREGSFGATYLPDPDPTTESEYSPTEADDGSEQAVLRAGDQQPVASYSLSHLTGDQVFQFANSEWLAPGTKSLQQEARIYALFAIAYDLGSEAAGKELVYLDAINQRMKSTQPDWLSVLKLEAREELARLRL